MISNVLGWPDFLLFLVFVCYAVCSVISAKRKRESFENNFPPISDAEFIARCAPEIDPNIAVRVRRVLAECLCVEEEQIYPSSRLVADLGAR
jgi:hypothetical protein